MKILCKEQRSCFDLFPLRLCIQLRELIIFTLLRLGLAFLVGLSVRIQLMFWLQLLRYGNIFINSPQKVIGGSRAAKNAQIEDFNIQLSCFGFSFCLKRCSRLGPNLIQPCLWVFEKLCWQIHLINQYVNALVYFKTVFLNNRWISEIFKTIGFFFS